MLLDFPLSEMFVSTARYSIFTMEAILLRHLRNDKTPGLEDIFLFFHCKGWAEGGRPFCEQSSVTGKVSKRQEKKNRIK